MVKCSKLLVYCAGEKESYGKDAEAAMALSLGKPVIFYCDQEQRGRFYRDVHPLSRLIEFETGVAVGAMVTDDLGDVSELIYRIFENRMVYYIEPQSFSLVDPRRHAAPHKGKKYKNEDQTTGLRRNRKSTLSREQLPSPRKGEYMSRVSPYSGMRILAPNLR
jgi:hypothetical protein